MYLFEMEQQLVHKKSGELVKSNLRYRSALATRLKLVHFDCDLEQVRHFFKSDRPISISAYPPPVDDNEQKSTFTQLFPSDYSPGWEIAMPNFTKASDRNRQHVQLESLHPSTDCQNLVGTVTVANVAFEKHVSTRFTTDNWQTMSEVKAEYCQSQTRTYDRFQFLLKLPDQGDLVISFVFCIRYEVNGQEYWDNNSGKNYLANIARKMPLKRFRTPDDRPRSHLNSNLLQRYNLAASLRAAKTPITARKRVSHALEPKETLTPASYQLRLNLNSTAYDNAVEHLLHFKSENAATKNTMPLSVVQPLSYPGIYPNHRSHAIHCF
jgi:hypothetical protein